MGLGSHPQFGLQNLGKVEQPWLFGELTGCQAGSQPSPPVALTTVTSGLLGPFAKPQAPTGSSKAQKAQAAASRKPHDILLLKVLLASRKTTSHLQLSHSAIWISAIIPAVPGVIQKTGSKEVSETNIEHL